MILTAVEVLRERGAGGLTIEEVLLRSGTPKGSVYHHFPGGRQELLDSALTTAGNAIAALLDRAATDGAEAVLDEFTRMWRRILIDSEYTAGCPVLSVAVSGTESADLVDKAGEFFTRWTAALTNAFVAEGIAADAARQLAMLSLSAIEGAVVMCRTNRGMKQLQTLINCHRFARDNFRGFAVGH
jgi:AcrR family transcriptional regulator